MDDQNFMTNSEGHLVPVDKVRPEDRLEDDTVRHLIGTAICLESDLRTFKQAAFDSVQAFLELLSEKYGAGKGGKKGNMTLTSYDGLLKVQISVADFIQFGPQLQIAKTLIDECIHDWSGGVNSNIRALVEHAFKVDKQGKINTQAILGLRRLDIRDEKWVKAMDAITDSLRVVNSKRYVRFYSRPSPEADWQPVTLDIAGV